MAKFTLTIECRNPSEALAYVKALAEARIAFDDECGACHGSGKVQKYVQPNVVETVDCLVCRGSGKDLGY